MSDSIDVDTRNAHVNPYVVVLGPYAHPVTGLLKVKCVVLSTFDEVYTLNDLGGAFTTSDMSERGIMVPDRDMIIHFIQDLRDELNMYPDPQLSPHNFNRMIYNLSIVSSQLIVREQALESLDAFCADVPDFQKRVRKMCHLFWEMALYYRRWAGPGRRIPVLLLQRVGSTSNPLSESIRGKFVTSSMQGVHLSSTPSAESVVADHVLMPEGTLDNLYSAYTRSILMIYMTFTNGQKNMVKKTFGLGTPFRIINGNGRFYLDGRDTNTDVNNNGLNMNLFDLCFGDPSGGTGFTARASVSHNGLYCVQLASPKILRCIQTVLPYIYNSRPIWAYVDGEFDNTHTID
jgi:hypothetical protein